MLKHLSSKWGGALASTLAVAILTLASFLTLATPSEAASNPCADGQRNYKIVTKWTEGKYQRTVPIRCGYWDEDAGRGYGVRKLEGKHHWNIWYEDEIGATLENPAGHWIQDNGNEVYVTDWNRDCDPVYRFRVIVDPKKVENPDGSHSMKGVTTAYQEIKK